jgi:hypothetical protein
MNCADCSTADVGPEKCPDGRLYYNATKNECVWADESTCKPKYDPEPEPEVEPTQPPKDPLPTPGTPCDPSNCKHYGYCTHFLSCNKSSQKWERHECGPDLYWNPEWNEEITGGSCDRLEDLPEEVREEYEEDESCFEPCWYREKEPCCNEFLFHPKGTDHREVLTLECPSGLVFDKETNSCNHCYYVKNSETNEYCCWSAER